MKRFLFLALILPLTARAEETLKDSTIHEVVVTATRNETLASRVAATVSVVDEETLTEHFRPSVLPTLVEQVPGLFSTSRTVLGYGVSTGAAGNMKIRGVGSGAQLLVLIDGQPQYAGLMGHPIPDAYQTLMAERVEVVRGPASVYYGSNAMAGVVNIVTPQMKSDGQQTHFQLGAGSYGTLQGQVSNRQRHGRFSSTAGINYQRTDGHRPNSRFSQEGAFLKLGYDLSAHWALSADANLTRFQASNPGAVDAPLIDNDSKIFRGLASASLSNHYSRTSGTIRGFYDWGHHNIDDGYSPGASPRTSHYLHNDHIAGLTAYQSLSLFEGNRLTVGLDWQHFGGHAWNRDNATHARAELVDTTQNEVGVYADFRQDITPWLSLDAGVRYDWHSQAGSEWVPQGGLIFHPTRRDDLKAMVSKGFRNPIIRELYMFPPHNPDLEPERMMNYELSYTHRFEGRGHVGANLFYIDGDNLINTIMQPTGRPMNINTGSFTNYGFEVEGAYRFNRHWTANANFSFLHMKKPIAGAPEEKLYVGATYECGPFQIVAGLQNIAGLYLTGGKEGHKEGGFTLLNATATYRLRPELRLFVKGDNLLAQRYQTYLGYPMPKATFMGGVSVDL